MKLSDQIKVIQGEDPDDKPDNLPEPNKRACIWVAEILPNPNGAPVALKPVWGRYNSRATFFLGDNGERVVVNKMATGRQYANWGGCYGWYYGFTPAAALLSAQNGVAGQLDAISKERELLLEAVNEIEQQLENFKEVVINE